MKSTILNDSYDSVLTLVEYILNWTSEIFIDRRSLVDNNEIDPITGCYKEYQFDEKQYMNRVFEKEFVGYRFVGDYIVAISDSIEMDEIEQSLDIKYEGCKAHIQNTLRFLSDRNKPDYKNSIKESISAVESICATITDNPKTTLGKTLEQLEDNGIIMHKALKKAFSSLYGYTSDQGGIRHAEGMFESNVNFEEAKFMLVSCCAFINFLIAQYGKSVK